MACRWRAEKTAEGGIHIFNKVFNLLYPPEYCFDPLFTDRIRGYKIPVVNHEVIPDELFDPYILAYQLNILSAMN
jgi:hypothetical protein